MSTPVIRFVRFLCLTLAALLVAVPALAQTGVGLKGGVSFSRLVTAPDSSDLLDPLTDFTAGVFVATSTSAPVAGQFEALVSRRGARIDGDLFGVGFLGNLFSYRTTYLDVSGLVRVNAGSGQTHVYLIGGPTFALKLQSEFGIDLADVGVDADAVTEDWDVLATVGAGVDLDGLVIEGRYSHGLRDVLLGADVLPFDAKLRAFSVLAGFRF